MGVVRLSFRNLVECAFGMLVMRWGIFWRPLLCRLRKYYQAAITCMALHNVCMDERLDVAHHHSDGGGLRPSANSDSRYDGPFVHTTAGEAGRLPPPQQQSHCTMVSTNRRDSMRDALREAAMIRPTRSTWGRNQYGHAVLTSSTI